MEVEKDGESIPAKLVYVRNKSRRKDRLVLISTDAELSEEEIIREDDKTICELCFCLPDEMEDITFSRSMRIILDALMDVVMEYFHITETQPEEFTASFIQRLPKYMQEALEREETAA